jgi:hypothetical protein
VWFFVEEINIRSAMPQNVSSVNKPGDKGLVVEKHMDKLQVFKEPFPPPVRPKIKTKRVLDEDSYIRVSYDCNGCYVQKPRNRLHAAVNECMLFRDICLFCCRKWAESFRETSFQI